MLSALPFTFSAPLALAALALLPALWLILRVTPPRPRRIDFPPLKIMADLVARRELPAHTPWWLLALRMAVAALAILAVAGPVWNPPREAATAGGPMLLAVDNGFGAAGDWPDRIAVAESRIAAATALRKSGPAAAWYTPAVSDSESGATAGGSPSVAASPPWGVTPASTMARSSSSISPTGRITGNSIGVPPL